MCWTRCNNQQTFGTTFLYTWMTKRNLKRVGVNIRIDQLLKTMDRCTRGIWTMRNKITSRERFHQEIDQVLQLRLCCWGIDRDLHLMPGLLGMTGQSSRNGFQFTKGTWIMESKITNQHRSHQEWGNTLQLRLCTWCMIRQPGRQLVKLRRCAAQIYQPLLRSE